MLYFIDISILSTPHAHLRDIYSQHTYICHDIYHDHIHIFHDTYKCNLLTESTNNTSIHIVVFKKLQTYTLWISILWVYIAHEEIISQ